VLDSSRIRSELGWTPTHTADETLRDVVEGMRAGAGGETPPLLPGRRLDELRAGVGGDQI